MKQADITESFVVLEQAYSKMLQIIAKKKNSIFTDAITENVDILIGKIDSNKSLLSALVTSLLKKVIDSKQDVRLHRIDFKNGYSARSLDTFVTVPFFKLHFPKYANKESSFLTLATRERIKWTKIDGQALKIRNNAVKNSFLELLDSIENGTFDPRICLIYIFKKLYHLTDQHQQIYDDTIVTADLTDIININSVIKLLEQHFKTKSSSRLPVIAIYSIYQELFQVFKRYDNKKLSSLNTHTSSDKHGYGDVEIWGLDNSPYEMVEIKHNIPIDRNMIFDIIKKSENTTIERYYILTTCKENFLSKDEEEFINNFILKIKKDSGLEVIANGIIFSIKYYLRFINDYKHFIQIYTNNLITDSKISTEIQEYHISEWNNILENHKIKVII